MNPRLISIANRPVLTTFECILPLFSTVPSGCTGAIVEEEFLCNGTADMSGKDAQLLRRELLKKLRCRIVDGSLSKMRFLVLESFYVCRPE